jgi:hypothetical protein
MATPQFDPNSSYSVPAFDPNAQYQATAPQASTSRPAYAGFTPSNIASNIGRGLKELGQGAVQGLSDIGGAILPQSVGGDPMNNLQLVHHVVDPLQNLAAQSRQDFANGQTAAGVQHALASGVPVIGPWYSGLTDQAASGDIGGAIARGATQVYAPKAVGAVAGVVGRSAVSKGIPAELYESAMKPSTTLSQAERADLVNTGLSNSIPISKGGVEKIGDLIDNLNQKIKAQIQADPNRPINTVPAVRNLDSVRARFANQVTPQPDLAEIDQVESNFLNNPKVQPTTGPGPSSLPASEAQAMKSGTYQALGNKAYGEVKGASVEAQKALARGLKEEIANQFPEINNLNAQESKLLDLEPVLERAVARNSNHQLIGIGTPIVGTAGAAMTGSATVGAVLGAMKAVFDNPMVKSRVAIALSKSAKIPLVKATARVNAYASSLTAAYGQNPASSGDNQPDQAIR